MVCGVIFRKYINNYTTMKIKILASFILFISFYCYSQTETVYFGLVLEDKTIKLEDQYTFLKNLNFWGKTNYGINYDNYYKYIENIVKSNVPNYSDTVFEYTLKIHVDEMDELTNIKIGDKFYVATKTGISFSEVIGYRIDLNDLIGGGIVFYPLLSKVSNDEEEIVLIKSVSNMSSIKWNNVTDKTTIQSFKNYLLPKVKHIKVIEGEDAGKKISSIKDEEIKILKGGFTVKGTEEYLVSWCKRISFESYACVTYIMDSDGSIIRTVFKLQPSDFNYTKVSAVCDINGDGIYEIITEEGYYEGHSWGLWKYDGEELNFITSGFYFGV